MKQIRILLVALLCLSMLCSPALCESDGGENWYELSSDDTVLTVRLPVAANSGASWTYDISNPEALELLTMETLDGSAGANGTWVASFAGTFEQFGDVTLLLRQTSSRSAAYQIDLFISENNQLELVYAGDAVEMQVRATGDANLRSDADVESKIVGFVKKDTICAYRGECSTDSRGVDWYWVDADGVGGWISSRYATIEITSGDVNTKNPTDQIVEVTGEKVNLRSEPDLSARVLDILCAGDTLAYLNDAATDSRGVVWYYVRADGGAGWVSSRYAHLR